MNQMTRIVAAPESFKARFTTAEFLRMCEADAFEDWKVELIDGELERMHQPKSFHAMRQASVMFQLAQAVGAERAWGDAGIDLGENTVVAGDAVVLRAIFTENRWLLPADVLLVVEVSETTLDRDLGMKRRKYAGAGIPEYWVVDGGRAVVHLFSDARDGDYADVSIVRFGEPLAVPGTDATITLS